MDSKSGMTCGAISAVAMIPITFWASLPPWAKLRAAEEINWHTLNHLSATEGLDRLARFMMIRVMIIDMIIPITGANTMKETVFKMALWFIATKGLIPWIQA